MTKKRIKKRPKPFPKEETPPFICGGEGTDYISLKKKVAKLQLERKNLSKL